MYDIVEDDDAAAQISSFYHRIHNRFKRLMTKRITKLADGIIVISSHLEAKFKNLTQKRLIALHFRPISVDLNLFPQVVQTPHKQITLFYAGSFGVKDGVENLIDAFGILASWRADLRLILAGKGSP